MKGCIILHPLNKLFIQLGHKQRCERTSLYEVFIEWMEYGDTFHTSAHCDLTVWIIYWVDGVRCNLSYFFSMWPHCIKYLLSEWSMMTPFIPLLIVTSLSEVFIEWMEYDDTFHTSAHGMKGVIILLPLNKYFIQWGHIEKKYERLHHTPSTQ
jgi:hypothetical protein